MKDKARLLLIRHRFGPLRRRGSTETIFDEFIEIILELPKALELKWALFLRKRSV